MRIISDFKDYYDFGQKFGFDPKIIYQRRKHVIRYDRTYYPYGIERKSKGKIKLIYVGFCGQVYRGVCFLPQYDFDNPFRYCTTAYSLDRIDSLVEYTSSKDLVDYYYNDTSRYNCGRKHVEEHLNPRTENKNVHSYLFERYRVPIFITDNIYLVLNARLSDVDFASVKEPLTAYQELSMYFGTFFADMEDKTPKIDDKTLAEAKGYDKMSFRKEKQ